MHAACGMGVDRRADVCLPARRVRVEIEESKTAFFGTLGERAASVSEDLRRREERTRISRPGSHMAIDIRSKFPPKKCRINTELLEQRWTHSKLEHTMTE